jgi:hypothetical protein
MPLKGIQARDINESVLLNLKAGQVPEGKTVDYKQELPGNTDSAKRDFLADLCSFANAVGGHMVYGMTESDGIPTELIGITGEIDKAVLRLESMARDGIRPPISGLEFIRVGLSNGNETIVVSIPKSMNPPHQVVFQKDYRFYTRGSAGKQHIDVDELRHIVLLSQETGERIRQFRANRIATVVTGDTPIELQAGARQILHFVPLAAFSIGAGVDLAPLYKNPALLISVMNRGGSQRPNVDGLLAYSPTSNGNHAYAQLFTSGILEIVVHVGEQTSRHGGRRVLPSLTFEEDLFEQVRTAIQTLKTLSVVPPVAVMLSFVGIKGWGMGVGDDWGTRGHSGGFDRDPLLIPELVLQTLDADDVPKLIKPVIDSTWNAAGFAQSDYYDSQGNWVGERRR